MSVRPTFMGFETATRGLMVNQKALDIVGHNVSNIGVTGYTRQRVDQVSLHVNMVNSRYDSPSTAFSGQGSAVYGVNQIRDDFLDKRFREEYSDVGYFETTSTIQEDLHSALDEISPSTMSTAMQKFQNAWNEMLAAGADENTGSANLMASATQIVQIFNQMSAKIDNVWEQSNYALELDVTQVNSTLEKIAVLNDEIRLQQHNAMESDNNLYQPLELLDQRNVLLDELSNYSNMAYELQEDGQVTVWMGEKGDANPPVVEGDKFDKLFIQINDVDPQFKTVTLGWNSDGREVDFASGSMKGNMDMLNGRGLGMSNSRGETFTEGIHYYKDKIDQFAQTFSEVFNNTIEYVDSNGAAYDPPRYKELFSFELDTYGNAAGIRLSEEWQNDNTYIIQDVKDKVVTDGTDGGGGSKENSYAAQAYKLFEETLDFGEFKGTINDYISFYSVTKLSNNTAHDMTRLEASVSVADTLLTQIQQVSGVSMEEEGVDMMMYQKAYDAMSRVFTTLDEMLEKLINGTGVVGR